MKPSQLTRSVVAISLVIGAVLTVVGVLLMPDFSGGHADRLTAIAGSRGTATVSALAFTTSQLFLAIGLLGVVHVVRSRVPVLAGLSAGLVLLGVFGHAVYGGVNLVMLSMAEDLDALDIHTAVLARGEQGIAIPFMAAGLLGTALGFILLGTALWRSELGPRWVGPALIAWVPLEFVGSGFSVWAGYASGALYALIFVTLATTIWRSSITHWETAAEVAGDDVPVERPLELGAA